MRTSTSCWCGSRARIRGCTSRSCRSSTASWASRATRARTDRRGSPVAGRLRPRVQDQGRDRLLREVELGPEVTEDRDLLADGGARVRAAEGRGVEALAAQETILDEPQEGARQENLVVDE